MTLEVEALLFALSSIPRLEYQIAFFAAVGGWNMLRVFTRRVGRYLRGDRRS